MNSVEKNILNLKDISLLTFIANFGVRWFAVAAAIGASAISFWALGAVFLALPLAYICAKLCQLFPQEGGLYAWVRQSLGERNGFIVAWIYFINNLFYYPAILIFLATNFSYFIGKPALANNNVYVCIVVLSAFWIVSLLSLYGLKANKLLTEYGGIIGSILPAILIIVLGLGIGIITHHSATAFTWKTILPNDNVSHSLANLTMLMFAMTGVEIIPTFANRVKNPKRDLYFGLLIGSVILIFFYAIGTVALNIILSPQSIHKTSGLMSAFQSIFTRFHMHWMIPVISLMLSIAELAAVSIWLIAPITMFFKCTPKGLLPNWLHKTNRYESPANAIWFVGVVVTIILLATNLLPAVNDMYQILVLMSVLFAFIPYLFIVIAFIKNLPRLSGSKVMHWMFSIVVFASLILGIAFSFQLPSNITTLSEKIIYELELFFGPIIFIGIGYLMYHHWEKKHLLLQRTNRRD